MRNPNIGRRTFLRGAGACLALPVLDCMANRKKTSTPPARLGVVYFPFGVSLPKQEDKQDWHWFPKGEGKDFQFNKSLKPLEPHREHLTVLGGLSHPEVEKIGGHDSGDTFLTGCDILTNRLRNVQSMDQIVAEHFAGQTRYDSLVMSTDGGVGEPTRSSTLSYNRHGRPIPAVNQPRRIYERLFGAGDPDTARNRRRLRSSAHLLDLVLEDANSVRRKLGIHDQQKLDEYMDSVRQVERNVEQSQAWIDIAKPTLTDEERERLKLDSDHKVPEQYIRTMYELIHLAFQTDSTRVATYQIASMGDATTLGGKFPQLLGFGKHLHGLAHSWNKADGVEPLGKWDRFLATEFSYFLTRMRNTAAAPESGDSLLDYTTFLYGSSNSTTHTNRNYPLVLAGGKKLGFKHGQYLKFTKDTPFSNIFSTQLQQIGLKNTRFGDSTGIVSELI
ncbi:MAG: DUF1552 domain-containing protein [Akkermansiaceae bacterium]